MSNQSFEQALAELMQDEITKEQMIKVAKGEMEKRIQEQFKWNLPDTIAKEVNEFITEHVVPEVRAHLISQKGAILKVAKASADELGIQIAAQMVATAQKNMADSWNAKKVLEALFQ